MRHTSEAENRERYILWEQGLNDRKIGEMLYLTPEAVCYWRRKMGLPSLFLQGFRAMQERRVKMRRDGMTIREIADAEGISETAMSEYFVKLKKRGVTV